MGGGRRDFCWVFDLCCVFAFCCAPRSGARFPVAERTKSPRVPECFGLVAALSKPPPRRDAGLGARMFEGSVAPQL